MRLLKGFQSAGNGKNSEVQLFDTSNKINAAPYKNVMKQTDIDYRTTLCFLTSGQSICMLYMMKIIRKLRQSYTHASVI